ncbi:MAG: hypothetical protein N2746_02185 [Deltaproteobacteria bacterium]|nr:hypothetical protein [Deltaproteobacteria bacterium]
MIKILFLINLLLLLFSCSERGLEVMDTPTLENLHDTYGDTSDAGGIIKFPECGSNVFYGHHLIPSEFEEGFNKSLADKVRRYDRFFHTFVTFAHGSNTELTISNSSFDKREKLKKFLFEYEGWDLNEFENGLKVTDIIEGWDKSAGLYAGAGIAADAMRYAILRDSGADCKEVMIAKEQLKRSIEALLIAFSIPATHGVVARGFANRMVPGIGKRIETLPLFDNNGIPLPYEKNNGTWREDLSGRYPHLVWEDSISRDMMLGWALAMAIVKEVINDDPSFEKEIKEQLRGYAKSVGEVLRRKRESGYDLEFLDADGRTPLHGYINENNVDGTYIPGLNNGFYATMALGIVAAYAYVSEDKEAHEYLQKVLVNKRRLHKIASEEMKFINMGLVSNFSNYNMVMISSFLAIRYIPIEDVRKEITKAIELQIYNVPNSDRQPIEMKQTLFDVIYAYSKTGGSIYSKPNGFYQKDAIERGLETLIEFPDTPFFDNRIENCDEEEIKSGTCVLIDGTVVTVIGYKGRNGDLITEEPIPMRVRPPSNFHWRTNPYIPNGGGDGTRVLSGVDLRFAYYLGRYLRYK